MVTISRRNLLRLSALSGTAFMSGKLLALAAVEGQGPTIRTTGGKVRGITAHGAHIFKGIPYGAPTSGEFRFRAPQPPLGWQGVRDAFAYGPRAVIPDMSAGDFSKWASSEGGQLMKGLVSWPLTRMGEDCLVLNVWTPTADPGSKLPVMVWLHGGGFGAGSGDWGWTDGTHLAAHHEVVIVSLNHRLNGFGFLYLADLGGPKYADSGNAGMLDIVAALRWVRDNISAFGGNPDNVTIFGQSGGGCKVNVLMAMPSAAGLFHRAINMSGPATRMLTRESANATTRQVLSQLQIGLSDIDRIQQVPAKSLVDAMTAVLDTAHLTLGDDPWRDGTFLHMFDPVVDGKTLMHDPFYPDASFESATVPLLIGNMGDEDRVSEFVDEAGMREDLKTMGLSDGQTNLLIQRFRASRPEAPLADVLTAIHFNVRFRIDAIRIAERRAALRRAPTYMYLFTWESPAFGGKYGSPHSADIPFVFDNLDASPGLWGPNPDPRRIPLAARVSEAWVTFARTGNPSHPGLPPWTPYTLPERATMEINYISRLVSDPRREDRVAAALATDS